MIATLLMMGQIWTSIPDPKAILQGHWQSCQDENGYAERIYSHCVGKRCDWELHMGPQYEFALFKIPNEEICIDDTCVDNHDVKENLLGPEYKVKVEYARGRRQWKIPSLRLWVSIVLAGGSRSECEGFLVRVEGRNATR
jgi:hypothetical protein